MRANIANTDVDLLMNFTITVPPYFYTLLMIVADISRGLYGLMRGGGHGLELYSQLARPASLYLVRRRVDE
jgi:hypothetical protein